MLDLIATRNTAWKVLLSQAIFKWLPPILAHYLNILMNNNKLLNEGGVAPISTGWSVVGGKRVENNRPASTCPSGKPQAHRTLVGRDTSTVRRGAACQRGGGIVLTREWSFDVPHHWWIMLMIPYCWHPQKEMFSLDLIVRSHACHSCIEQLLADFPFRSLNQSAKCNMLNHGFFLLLLFW